MKRKQRKKSKSVALTAFDWKVLKAAAKIPLGATRTYAWVAKTIGHPKAMRAVGQSLRKNPYPIIIPCHRVIKSDGALGGYAGKYDGRKKLLLDVERAIASRMKKAAR